MNNEFEVVLIEMEAYSFWCGWGNMKKDASQRRIDKKKTVTFMIRLYCRGKHGSKGKILCKNCNDLSEYAEQRIEKCPHMETKTFCSSCKTHCYKPEKREKIREVMRYAGPRMPIYHPIIAIHHLADTIITKRKTVTEEHGDWL